MRPPLAPPARRVPGPGRPRGGEAARRRTWRSLALLGLLAVGLPGCSLFVMGGKMLFGDPAETPAFEAATHVDLTDGEHTVLVLASSPESVKARFPEVDQELVRRVGRKLRGAGVEVENGDRVLDWVEERGGVWSESHLGPIAAEFDVDYLIVIDLDRFDWFETNSPDLLRGRSSGWIRAFAANGGGAGVSHVLAGEFESVYPQHRPESAGSMSQKVFRERYLDRLCQQAAQRFIPYHQRDTVH